MEQFRSRVDEKIKAVQNRAHFILGPEVEEFEARFAAYLGTDYCVGVANGTQAIEVTLRALGIGPGHQVVTVANAGMYATCAILATGGLPLFAEVREETMNMDADSLARLLSQRPRAVIVTHLYGQMCEIGKIAELCRDQNIPLIEDCAEAHGACIEGKKAGSFGIAGCFSFYPTKNLGAYGDAGAVTTSDAQLAKRLKSLRQYGWSQKYFAEMPGGTNSRMDELQAAVLNAKLEHLDEMNGRRCQIVSRFNAALAGKAEFLPFTIDKNFIVHHYVLRSDARDEVMAALGARGIATDIHFPVPDHRQTALACCCKGVSLPVTERICGKVFTVPSFPEMTDTEVEFVEDALRQNFRP